MGGGGGSHAHHAHQAHGGGHGGQGQQGGFGYGHQMGGQGKGEGAFGRRDDGRDPFQQGRQRDGGFGKGFPRGQGGDVSQLFGGPAALGGGRGFASGGGFSSGASGQHGHGGGGHSNLFVGNLPENASEQVIHEAFSQYGQVISCRVFARSGRTCALVKMASVGEAEAASRGIRTRNAAGDPQFRWLVKFADSDIGGSGAQGPGSGGDPSRGGQGSQGQGQGSSWGGGGPSGGAASGGCSWDKGYGGALGKAGGGKGSPNGGGGVGFGGSSFASFGGAFGKGGVGASKGGGGGKSRRDRDQAEVPPSDNLYVKGLPPRITDAQLRKTFSKAGAVIELKILRYGDSHECAALVRMASIEGASKAIETLNGETPEGAAPTLTICYHGKDPTKQSDNLYVKGLPINFTQDHLSLLFGQCGTVRRSRLLLPPTSRPMGGVDSGPALDTAALIQMASAEEARAAIQSLHGTVPEGAGPQMSVRYAEVRSQANAELGPGGVEPNDNLYVKGLPLGTPDFLLRAVFAQFGTVVWLKVLDPRGAEALDCAALVQMATVDEAQAAVAALHGRVLSAPLQPMRVRFAGKEQQPGSNLYVGGLPITIHEQQLRTTFSECGVVMRLRLLVQPGRPETHALVQMSSPDEAEVAINKLHGAPPQTVGPTLVVRYAKNKGKGDGKGNALDGKANAEASAEDEEERAEARAEGRADADADGDGDADGEREQSAEQQITRAAEAAAEAAAADAEEAAAEAEALAAFEAADQAAEESNDADAAADGDADAEAEDDGEQREQHEQPTSSAAVEAEAEAEVVSEPSVSASAPSSGQAALDVA